MSIYANEDEDTLVQLYIILTLLAYNHCVHCVCLVLAHKCV